MQTINRLTSSIIKFLKGKKEGNRDKRRNGRMEKARSVRSKRNIFYNTSSLTVKKNPR